MGFRDMLVKGAGYVFVILGLVGNHVSFFLLGLLILITEYMYDTGGGGYDGGDMLGKLFTRREVMVIDILYSHGNAISLSTLSEELRMNKVTLWRVLNKLCSRGIVEKEKVGRNILYRLGDDTRRLVKLLREGAVE